LGGIALPACIYAYGSRRKSVPAMRIGAIFAILGIVLNRFNVCLVAFHWQLPSAERYFPSVWEVCISIFVVTLIVTIYRFITWNMPILYEHPDYKGAHGLSQLLLDHAVHEEPGLYSHGRHLGRVRVLVSRHQQA